MQTRRTRQSGHLQDLLLVERLVLEERLGQCVQLRPILFQQADSFGMALPQHALDFDIDRAGRRFAIGLRHAEPGWEIVAWGECHRPQLVAHASAGDHLPSQGARLLDVVLGAAGRKHLPQNEIQGRAVSVYEKLRPRLFVPVQTVITERSEQ